MQAILGGLAIIILSGLILGTLLCCKQRKARNRQDQGDCEHSLEQVDSKEFEDSLKMCTTSLSLQSPGNNNKFTTNILQSHSLNDDEEDDGDYDDTVIPSNMIQRHSIKEREEVLSKTLSNIVCDFEENDDDYDDIVVSSGSNHAKKPILSFQTELNPAYSSSHQCSSINSVPRETENESAGNILNSHPLNGDEDDDGDYDDTITPTNMIQRLPKEREDVVSKMPNKVACDFEEKSWIACDEENDDNYDDIIISSKTNNSSKPTVSFQTDLNPAYCSSHNRSQSINCVPRETHIKSTGNCIEMSAQSVNCEHKHKNDEISKEFTDGDDYVNVDGYVPNKSKGAMFAYDENSSEVKVLHHSLQERHKRFLKSAESPVNHEYDYPCVTIESLGAQTDANSQCTVVVHDYCYTTSNVVEHVKSLSPTPTIQQGKSLPLHCNLNNEHHHNGNTSVNSNEVKEQSLQCNSSLAEQTDNCVRDQNLIYENTMGVSQGTKAKANTKSMRGDHGTDKEGDKKDDETDYVYDRLGVCVYLDREEFLTGTASSGKTKSSVENVEYTRLSPVTFWQDVEWSQDDLLRANAVYTDVRKLKKASKKPELTTLDQKLGTLV